MLHALCTMALLANLAVPTVAHEPPIIEKVTTAPYTKNGTWVMLPKNGKLDITVDVKGPVNRVEFYVVPTGTQTWQFRRLIGEDTNPRDGWSFAWYYGDQEYHDHVVVLAIGPGGESQTSFNVISN